MSSTVQRARQTLWQAMGSSWEALCMSAVMRGLLSSCALALGPGVLLSTCTSCTSAVQQASAPHEPGSPRTCAHVA